MCMPRIAHAVVMGWKLGHAQRHLGRATGCTVYTSSGVPQIDQATCQLVEARLRFAPARDSAGRPRVDKYAYMQAPVNF